MSLTSAVAAATESAAAAPRQSVLLPSVRASRQPAAAAAAASAAAASQPPGAPPPLQYRRAAPPVDDAVLLLVHWHLSLGSGGFATVHPTSDPTLAMKCLFSCGREEADREQLVRARMPGSPHVTPLRAISTIEVGSLADGVDLSLAMVRFGGLDDEVVPALARAVAAAETAGDAAAAEALKERLRATRHAMVQLHQLHPNGVLYQRLLPLELADLSLAALLSHLHACRARLEPADAVRAAWGVCRALAACHEAGVAHGDFKAENVLVLEQAESSGGEVVFKVSDFGAAIVERTAACGGCAPVAECLHPSGSLTAPEALLRRAEAQYDLDDSYDDEPVSRGYFDVGAASEDKKALWRAAGVWEGEGRPLFPSRDYYKEDVWACGCVLWGLLGGGGLGGAPPFFSPFAICTFEDVTEVRDPAFRRWVRRQRLPCERWREGGVLAGEDDADVLARLAYLTTEGAQGGGGGGQKSTTPSPPPPAMHPKLLKLIKGMLCLKASDRPTMPDVVRELKFVLEQMGTAALERIVVKPPNKDGGLHRVCVAAPYVDALKETLQRLGLRQNRSTTPTSPRSPTTPVIKPSGDGKHYTVKVSNEDAGVVLAEFNSVSQAMRFADGSTPPLRAATPATATRAAAVEGGGATPGAARSPPRGISPPRVGREAPLPRSGSVADVLSSVAGVLGSALPISDDENE